MSKLIHFRDQLAATSNPDPVLYFLIFEDDHFELQRTKRNVLSEDLIGLRFEMMTTMAVEGVSFAQLPVFVNELVDA